MARVVFAEQVNVAGRRYIESILSESGGDEIGHVLIQMKTNHPARVPSSIGRISSGLVCGAFRRRTPRLLSFAARFARGCPDNTPTPRIHPQEKVAETGRRCAPEPARANGAKREYPIRGCACRQCTVCRRTWRD